jgi:hypothetical protein
VPDVGEQRRRERQQRSRGEHERDLQDGVVRVLPADSVHLDEAGEPGDAQRPTGQGGEHGPAGARSPFRRCAGAGGGQQAEAPGADEDVASCLEHGCPGRRRPDEEGVDRTVRPARRVEVGVPDQGQEAAGHPGRGEQQRRGGTGPRPGCPAAVEHEQQENGRHQQGGQRLGRRTSH